MQPALLLFAAIGHPASFAQTPPSPTNWQSDSVRYFAGLADMKPDSLGTLRLTSDGLKFSTKDGHGEIPFNLITNVSTGDERVATGGTGAKIVRKIPIFGIGAITGAVTNKTVDLLTVEYRDSRGGAHGAVFEVPKAQAAIAQQQLLAARHDETPQSPTTCDGDSVPQTMLVMPIASERIDLPAEYRVLLYEELVGELVRSSRSLHIVRAGDLGAPCTATRLQLSVTTFKKGNEAVRASTGPVGLFVGGTSVKFQLDLSDHAGVKLFEKTLKESKHGDGDSLTLTRDLAKSVTKHLEKAGQTGTIRGS